MPTPPHCSGETGSRRKMRASTTVHHRVAHAGHDCVLAMGQVEADVEQQVAEGIEEPEGRQHGPGPHREAHAFAAHEQDRSKRHEADESHDQNGLPGAIDLDGPVGSGEGGGVGRGGDQGVEDRPPHHGGRVFRRCAFARRRRPRDQPDPGHGGDHRDPMDGVWAGAEGDRDRHRDRRVAGHHRRGERHRPVGHGMIEQDRAEHGAGTDPYEPVDTVEAPFEGLARRCHGGRNQRGADRHHRAGRHQDTHRAAGETRDDIRDAPRERAARSPGGGAL